MRNQYLKQLREMYGDELYLDSVSNLTNSSSVSGFSRNNETNLEPYNKHINKCQKFIISDVNEKIVFGLGGLNASLLLVGDATGEQDALQFEPFVGPALKLLDKILLAINCSRQKDVYICNVLKDEPPKNKVFLPIEENESESYLFNQINLIKPKLIVALGRVAGMRLLNVDNSLKSMRGVIHDYNKTPLIVTYHPIDLLEDFNRKSEAWKDFKWIRSLIE